MLPVDPPPRKPILPASRLLDALATGLAALFETAGLAVLTCLGDVVVVILAVLVGAPHYAKSASGDHSKEAGMPVLVAGIALGVLVALAFLFKRQYWRALGVVLGLVPLALLTQWL